MVTCPAAYNEMKCYRLRQKGNIFYIWSQVKNEPGFCVLPTSDTQSLEYCSVSVRLWPLGGANKERDRSSLSISKGADAASVGQLQECGKGEDLHQKHECFSYEGSLKKNLNIC